LPDNEEWAYQTGQEVTNQQHVFSDGTSGLIVTDKAPYARLDLTLEELHIVQNALNEICNGIALEGEFETRIGSSIDAARTLLKRVSAAPR
jgi:hypothetical protein